MPRNRKTDAAMSRQPVMAGERPVRMCVICRRRFAKATLIRHVLTPQGALLMDAEKNKPGRGWYVCSDPVCERRFAHYRPNARRRGEKHA